MAADGRCNGGGTLVARIDTSSSQPVRNSGTDEISKSAYGWKGGDASDCRLPVSTFRPAYSTTISSHTARTVEISWLMNI